MLSTHTIQDNILRIGIPAVVVLLVALFGTLLRDTTVKAEAANIAERFVFSDDAAEDAGELRALLIHCDISVPAALSMALDTAFTARPIPYRQGFNGASARVGIVDCNALERTAKNYTRLGPRECFIRYGCGGKNHSHIE
jgi:hypothetical protein